MYVRGMLEESEKARHKFEQQSEQAEAEACVLRKTKKELEDRITSLDNARISDDERYRALLRDFDALSGIKTENQKRMNVLEESLRAKETIVQNLESVNAELKRELARSRAPTQETSRSQSADATTPTRRAAASAAGSSGSSRSSSCTSLGSKSGRRSAKPLKNH